MSETVESTIFLEENGDVLILEREYQDQIHSLVYFLSGISYKRTDTLKACTFLKEGLKYNDGKLLDFNL